MIGDRKKLAKLREETGVCYYDKEQVEKAIKISDFSISFSEKQIDESKAIIKRNKKYTSLFVPCGIDESLFRRRLALNKIEEAKKVTKECKETIKREQGRSKVLKRQYKKLNS